MADVRIKDLATEAPLASPDDFLELDGATNGTRKLKLANQGMPHFGARPGILSAGTAAVGTTQDNAGLAFGTGDLTIGAWVRLPDWTPGTTVTVLSKTASNLGLRVQVVTTGVLRVQFGNGTNFTTLAYSSTVATGLTDGAWAFLAITFDRDGNAVFSVNGAALGDPVAISASAAQTLTNTGTLQWLSDGASHFAGTLGESWIIAGLLTSTQIANIYRAGSIAQFCTFTSNATTGLDVATIGGLSFFQWIDFGQGYGPIFRDRSGNNRHAIMGTTGLSHAVPRNPPGLPRRAPQAALVSTGQTGNLLRATLNSQNPDDNSSEDFTLWWDGIIPVLDSTSASRVLVSLTPSATITDVERAMWISANPTAPYGLRFLMYGGSLISNNQRSLDSDLPLLTHLVGKRFVFAVTRGRVYIGVDGEFYDMTSAFRVYLGATPPAWTDQIDGQYLVGMNRDVAGQGTTASTFDIRLANYAMTEAQLREEYLLGKPGRKWLGAFNGFYFQSDYSAGTDGVSGDSGHQITGNNDAINGEDNWLKVERTTSTGNLYCFRAGNVYGKMVRVRAKVYVPAGSSSIQYIQMFLGNAENASGQPTAVAIAEDTEIEIDQVVRSPNPGGADRMGFRVSNSAGTAHVGTVEVGHSFYVKEWSIEPIGYTALLDTDNAVSASQALNAARSTLNDSTDFLMVGAGMAVNPEPTTGTIRVSGTATGYLLADQRIIPAGWFIESIRVDADGTLSLGSSAASPTDVLELAGTELVGDTPSTGKLYLTLGTATTFALTIMIRRA